MKGKLSTDDKKQDLTTNTTTGIVFTLNIYPKGMKSNIHPTMHPVVFVDTSCGAEFVTTSTLTSNEKRDIDGVAHYVLPLEISSASHPFYTGQHRFVDTSGRVDKFAAKLEKVKEAAGIRKGKAAKKVARAKKNEEDADDKDTK
jgi:large subunit ribosomal protein L31